MKSKLDTDTTPEQKMQRFQSALGRILAVPKSKMKELEIEDEHIRRMHKRKPGPKSSGHASGS